MTLRDANSPRLSQSPSLLVSGYGSRPKREELPLSRSLCHLKHEKFRARALRWRTILSSTCRRVYSFAFWVGEHVCHVVIQMATMISHSLFYPVAYPCLRGKRQSNRTGNLPVPAHETVHLKVSITIYRVRLVYGYQCLRLDHARQSWPSEVINFLTLWKITTSHYSVGMSFTGSNSTTLLMVTEHYTLATIYLAQFFYFFCLKTDLGIRAAILW